MPEDSSVERNPTLEANDGVYRCRLCDIVFKTERDKKLHDLAHPSNSQSEEEIVQGRDLLYREVQKQTEEVGAIRENGVKYALPTPQAKPRRIYKPQSKRVGLTKIRMEDCLRCDPCSCIYIDPSDYYKHMTNFHQKYNTVIPRARRRSPTPQTIVEEPVKEQKKTEAQIEQPTKREKKKPEPIDLSFIAGNLIRHSINSRWSKVSGRISQTKRRRIGYSDSSSACNPNLNRRPNNIETQKNKGDQSQLDPNLKIKQEQLEDEMQFLLSQVEVKIEPTDDYE